MADSKVSALTAATSVNSADVLYLIQSSTDKKISISTLLANLPATLAQFTGLVALGGTAQTLVGSGAINITSTLTLISNSGTAALTLADGTYNGQLKTIVMTGASATSTLSANIYGVSTVAFSAQGKTVTLMYVSSLTSWVIIGGTATITY